MEEKRVCQQCGDSGFTNAFVYCVRCLNFAMHRYCLPVIPKTLDEFVRWVCDDCEVILQSQLPVHKHDVSLSPTTDRTVSTEIGRFSSYETEKNDLAVVQTQTDEHVHKDGHEQSSDAADESEKKVEKDLIRKSKRTLGKGKKMYQMPKKRMSTQRKRKRPQNVIDTTTKKDQNELGKRKDQTPKKRKKTTWTRKKRRRKNVIQSATNTENSKLSKKSSGRSCEDVVKVEINGCERLASESALPSEVRESNGLDEREKICISEKNSDSNTFPSSVEHTAISCNEPLRKKRKTIELSKLVSSNDRIGNREPEDKEDKVSATLHRRDICQDYPKALDLRPAEPVVLPIWRGSFSILNKKYDKLNELVAHISSKACRKVYEEATQFQPTFQFEMLPKSKIWPKSFMTSEPSGDNIALYFFPSKRSEQDFDHLVEKMISKELGLKAVVQNAELLIFTSTELPLLYWRFSGKYYLWGVFRGKQNPPSQLHSSEGALTEIPPSNNGSGGSSKSESHSLQR